MEWPSYTNGMNLLPPMLRCLHCVCQLLVQTLWRLLPMLWTACTVLLPFDDASGSLMVSKLRL